MFWHGWLIYSPFWKELAKKVDGLRWQKTLFTRFGAQSVPKKSGIYMLYTSPPEVPKSLQRLNFQNPMYIGKAVNLQQRIFQHLGKNADDNIKELRTHFKGGLLLCYAEAALDEIEDIEDIMLFCFWPSANRKIKILGRVNLTGFNVVFNGKAAVRGKSFSAYYNQRR